MKTEQAPVLISTMIENAAKLQREETLMGKQSVPEAADGTRKTKRQNYEHWLQSRNEARLMTDACMSV